METGEKPNAAEKSGFVGTHTSVQAETALNTATNLILKNQTVQYIFGN